MHQEKVSNIKVKVEYTWEFTPKEWYSKQDHEKAIQDIKSKMEEDQISTFYYLNDICFPDYSMKITYGN